MQPREKITGMTVGKVLGRLGLVATALVGTAALLGSSAAVGAAATATTQRVSVSSTGGQGNEASREAMISADGRYVVFTSFASNLIAHDTNQVGDIFVRDLRTQTTRRVSVTSGGDQAAEHSWFPSISDGGRYVAFRSLAALVSDDSNGESDIYVRDRAAKTTQRVSVSTSGVQGNAMSRIGLVSPDGRFVVFDSQASTLVATDTNGKPDVFLRNMARRTTTRISVSSSGAQAEGARRSTRPRSPSP